MLTAIVLGDRERAWTETHTTTEAQGLSMPANSLERLMRYVPALVLGASSQVMNDMSADTVNVLGAPFSLARACILSDSHKHSPLGQT